MIAPSPDHPPAVLFILRLELSNLDSASQRLRRRFVAATVYFSTLFQDLDLCHHPPSVRRIHRLPTSSIVISASYLKAAGAPGFPSSISLDSAFIPIPAFKTLDTLV